VLLVGGLREVLRGHLEHATEIIDGDGEWIDHRLTLNARVTATAGVPSMSCSS
jgi:hypothetical protein